MMDLDEYRESKKNFVPKVYMHDKNIIINVTHEYNIDLNRCDTAEKLLHWIWHLTEKSWMTNDVMREFIEVACQESNIKMKKS